MEEIKANPSQKQSLSKYQFRPYISDLTDLNVVDVDVFVGIYADVFAKICGNGRLRFQALLNNLH